MEILNLFINTYPIAAAIFGIVAIGIIVAIVKAEFSARKKNLPMPITNDTDGCVFMKLKDIQLFPENPAMELQIITYVNGMEFHYPSKDKSKWISMEQSMGEIMIELPNAELYRIHLAVHLRTGQTLEGGPAIVRKELLQPPPQTPATSPTTLRNIRVTEDYKLYLLEDGLRDTTIQAMIPYELYVQ